MNKYTNIRILKKSHPRLKMLALKRGKNLLEFIDQISLMDFDK